MDSSSRVKSPVSSSARPANNKSSRNPNLSPPTARLSAKLRSPNSTPSTPEPSRLRSLTNTAPAPLHHALSFSSLQPSLKPSDASPSIRVTSKVSRVAKSGAPPTSQSTSKPHHIQTGSGSSTVTTAATTTTSPPPTFYPITTAVPAANPFRYAPSRPPAYKPVAPPIKPDAIVSRPHSPPASAVSISSRSSVSYSSPVSHKAAAAADGFTHPDVSSSSEPSPITLSKAALLTNGRHERHSSSDSHDYDWGDDDDDDDSDEHKVKAAAKSNRKIADLEITNKSLMAINASLEKTKHKQAKEIRDLRRKLRESRLILPPRAYRAIKFDDTPAEDGDEGGDGDDDGDDDDDDDNEGSDEAFSRLKAMLGDLLETGKRALETKVADFGGAGSAAKVLSAEEVWSWRRDSVGDNELEPDYHNRDFPPAFSSRVAIRDIDDVDDLDIDDHSVLLPSIPPPAPPIFITPSP